MVSDVLSWLDFTIFAEAALVLFVLVFAGVSVAMAKMTPEWSGRCAGIPLSECESSECVSASSGTTCTEVMPPAEQV